MGQPEEKEWMIAFRNLIEFNKIFKGQTFGKRALIDFIQLRDHINIERDYFESIHINWDEIKELYERWKYSWRGTIHPHWKISNEDQYEEYNVKMLESEDSFSTDIDFDGVNPVAPYLANDKIETFVYKELHLSLM